MIQRNTVRFASTVLQGTNKVGRLPRNSDGYYTMPVGGLNVFNSMGEYYTVEGARDLFLGSGALMRRISSGCQKGEYGHPKPERPIKTEADMNEFAARVVQVVEARTCVHFRAVWLDFDNFRDDRGNPFIGIMAELCPSGPLGPVLEKELENPSEEVCFSIRAFTEDNYIRGVKHRTLREIVTWDKVTEPGLNMARKWKSPTLESFKTGDVEFTREAIESTLVGADGLAMESTQASGLHLMKALGWEIDPKAMPRFMGW